MNFRHHTFKLELWKMKIIFEDFGWPMP